MLNPTEITWDADDPGPNDDDLWGGDVSPDAEVVHRISPSPSSSVEKLSTEVEARWLGLQSVRAGCIEAARALVVKEVAAHFEMGTSLPPESSLPSGMSPARRVRYVRELDRLARIIERPSMSEFPVQIVRIVQRRDVGTASRYDVTLKTARRQAVLCDLLAVDLLNYPRLQPIACDAGMVLPMLSKGGAKMWNEEVDRAMENREVRDLEAEESEAMEIKQILIDMAKMSTPWTWAEDNPMPVGLASIDYHDKIGWLRATMLREVRARLGKVTRVAFARAIKACGWVRIDWHIETSYLRVYSCSKDVWMGRIRD